MKTLSHATKQTIKTDMTEWLKRRDLFGVPIGLTYKFYPVHRTLISASLSMLMRIYMVYFAASTFIKIYSGHTENIHSQI